MYLNVLDTFKCNFLNNYENYLTSRLFVNLMKSNNIVEEYINIYMHGNDLMILNLCLSILTNKITNSKISAVKKTACHNIKFDHYWHLCYFLIDINELTYACKCNLMDFLKQLDQQVSLNDKCCRHIIILKNFNKLNNKFLGIIKVFLEKGNIFFVFLSSKITQWSKNNCLNINCSVNTFTHHKLILQDLKIENIDDFTLERYLHLSEGNICKFLIVLESCKNEVLLESFIEKFIDTLVKYKNKNEQKITTSIIDTSTKLEISSIAPDEICKIIINILLKKNNNNICEIIDILSTSEVKILKSNKQTYSFQEMFYKLLKYI